VLGLEEAAELLVGDLDSEMAEQLANEPRILDLVDGPGRPEERLVLLAEVGCDLLGPGRLLAVDRLEPGLESRLDEVLVVRKVHEGVAPIEENGAQHAG
jgi:hypothetical protein